MVMTNGPNHSTLRTNINALRVHTKGGTVSSNVCFSPCSRPNARGAICENSREEILAAHDDSLSAASRARIMDGWRRITLHWTRVTNEITKISKEERTRGACFICHPSAHNARRRTCPPPRAALAPRAVLSD
jgi:hypothetical protein